MPIGARPEGQRGLWAVAALLAAYVATRLWQLTALPMFTDEAFYITWGLRALHGPRLIDRLESIADGKQPLVPWLMAPFLAVTDDRLAAGRMAPLLTGAAGLVALYLLARRHFGWPTAAAAAAIYLAAPLTLFHNRIVLYDGPIADCALVVLATATWWGERPSRRRAVALGLAMGVALLTKVSAAVFVIAAPLAAVLLVPASRRAWRQILLAYGVGAAVFAPLLLHPQARMLFQGTTDRYAFTTAELLQLPWRVWWESAKDLWVGVLVYLPAPLWCLFVAGLALPLVTRDRRDAVFSGWALLLLGTMLVAAKVYYFRYYVPGLVAAVLPAARALVVAVEDVLSPAVSAGDSSLRRRRGAVTAYVLAGAVGVTLVPSLAMDWALWTDVRGAPLPEGVRGDRFRYVTSHNTAWEFDGVVGFLRQEAAKQDIVVVVPTISGLTRGWAEANLLYWPRVHVLVRTQHQTPLEQILALPADDETRRLAVGGSPVYVVASEWADSPAAQPYAEEGRDPAILVADVPRRDIGWRHRVYALAVPRELVHQRLNPPPAFGGAISLVGYELQPVEVKPGGTAEVSLSWRAGRPLNRSYVVFVHVLAPDGSRVAQADGEPGSGLLPTNRWPVGAVLADRHQVQIPSGAPCGAYRLLVGWFERTTMQRLPRGGDPRVADQQAVPLGPLPVTGCG